VIAAIALIGFVAVNVGLSWPTKKTAPITTKDSRLIRVSAEVFRELRLHALKTGVPMSRVLDQIAAELPRKEQN
jgi:hypothetical protein